jgi:hypothetical protein
MAVVGCVLAPLSLVAVWIRNVDREPEGDVEGGRPGQQPHHVP